jgi:transposase
VSSARPSYGQLAELVVAQAATIERLEVRVSELEGEVVELKRRLNANSRNSSRPPSSDGLSKPPTTKSLRRPSGRKQGGQPGHEGGTLKAVSCPDEVVRHSPSSCSGCGASLGQASVEGCERRQLFDLPEIRLHVTEHVVEARRCGCGQLTTADFPAGVSAPTQYGPRVRALALYLIARQHLPYGRTAELFADWLAAPVSTATLASYVAKAASGLDGFLDEVHRQLVAAPVAHFDETGARVEGRLRWLFSASTDRLTSYSLHDKRGFDGLDHAGVLPAFAGIAVHDGFKPYRRYTNAKHALCNVHHLRELLGVVEPDPADPKIAWAVRMDRLLRDLQTAVADAKATGHERLNHDELASYRAGYAQIIADGNQLDPPGTTRTGKRGVIRQTPARCLLTRLDRYREDVMRFASDFRVPFDNNIAERDIRMIKLQQKISGSWRTSAGASNFLALRAYLSTAHKQGRNPIDVLTRLAAAEPWIPQAAGP